MNKHIKAYIDKLNSHEICLPKNVEYIHVDFNKKTIHGTFENGASNLDIAFTLQALANHILIMECDEYIEYDEGRIYSS